MPKHNTRSLVKLFQTTSVNTRTKRKNRWRCTGGGGRYRQVYTRLLLYPNQFHRNILTLRAGVSISSCLYLSTHIIPDSQTVSKCFHEHAAGDCSMKNRSLLKDNLSMVLQSQAKPTDFSIETNRFQTVCLRKLRDLFFM